MGKRVWLDMETTGLDPFKMAPVGPYVFDVPLEIGVVVTDMDGRFENKFDTLVWKDEDDSWHHALDRAMVHPIVGPMHRENGLFKDLENLDRIMRPEAADAAIAEFLIASGVEHGQSKLHGSSVYFDRIFMKMWFPQFFDCLHYRNVDISTIKTECQNWNPQVYAGLDTAWEHPTKAHRVIEDIEDSISEWAFYVENFLWTEGDD